MGLSAMDKCKKCFVMKEQQRSFTFCFNRPRLSSGSVPLGQASEPLGKETEEGVWMRFAHVKS